MIILTHLFWCLVSDSCCYCIYRWYCFITSMQFQPHWFWKRNSLHK